MITPPPLSTPTDPLFPFTTLFRSCFAQFSRYGDGPAEDLLGRGLNVMLFRCTVAARQFLAPNLFEMGEDRGLAAQAIEIVVRGRTPPGRHIDFELGAEMVDHGLARLTRDNRVERPGDGPGEIGRASCRDRVCQYG